MIRAIANSTEAASPLIISDSCRCFSSDHGTMRCARFFEVSGAVAMGAHYHPGALTLGYGIGLISSRLTIITSP